ncbi:MAG: hypothetical protein O2904_01520 [bacterium]|nr:hypothetical protein [bacterium]
MPTDMNDDGNRPIDDEWAIHYRRETGETLERENQAMLAEERSIALAIAHYERAALMIVLASPKAMDKILYGFEV